MGEEKTDSGLMDQLFFNECWVEPADAADFNLQPHPSVSCVPSDPPSYLPSLSHCFSLNPYHISGNQAQREHSSFEAEVATTTTLAQSSGRRSTWWMGTLNRDMESDSSTWVKGRLVHAIAYLQELIGEREFLIQTWVPIKRGSTRVLSTEEQAYSLNPRCISLALYRDVSEAYSFAAEADSDQMVGLPSRVFLRKLPEWTPDVRFFESDEYPRIGYARKYHVRGSLALPVFEGGTGTCLGVMEIITTTQKMDYRPELLSICRALQAVDLRSSHSNWILPRSIIKAPTEVAALLQAICGSHRLPLALTWAPCPHHSSCISTVHSTSFAADDDSRSFLAACSDHHLLRAQGIAGRAFSTNKSCFATNVSLFTKSTYPLSHYARMFGLHAALAVPLRSRATGAVELVLELFFPKDSRETGTQRQTLDALVAELHQRFRCSTHLALDEELAEEVIFPIMADANQPTLVQETSPEDSPWISHMVEANRRGKDVSLSWEYQREEEFKLTMMTSQGESSSSCVYTAEKKRRSKAEKDITLEILRQHFAGSLKDAAKSIGVCPTTLKRICRQHGILRWPSRKIKKVSRSLSKLQHVMDSVKGVQGSLHLSSFYSSFPQLTNAPDDPKIIIKPEAAPPISPPSSSGSQTSSGSSTCCSTGTDKSYTIDVNTKGSAAEDAGRLHKRACSDPQNAFCIIHNKTPPRPPLPAGKTTSVGKDSKGSDAVRVKATFGDSKVRLSLQPHWRLKDLRREIAKRFAIDVASNFSLKYLDDDREWVLLTCDTDLEECIDISRSKTIRILVHHTLRKPIP